MCGWGGCVGGEAQGFLWGAGQEGGGGGIRAWPLKLLKLLKYLRNNLPKNEASNLEGGGGGRP